jgi:hypothetical protein
MRINIIYRMHGLFHMNWKLQKNCKKLILYLPNLIQIETYV